MPRQQDLESVDQIWVDFKIATMVEQAFVPYGLQTDWWIGTRHGKIIWLEPQPECLPSSPQAAWIWGEQKLLTPGLIDGHTHCVFGGNRADEWERRLLGESYQTIAASGGGILSTVRATRSASAEALFQSARSRIGSLIADGVTTIEIKSGYGLDLESELKMLQVVHRLGQELGIEVVPTLLAAHTIAPEFYGRADDYIAWVCSEMIPAARHLCDAVDVFCETIAFSVPQATRVLKTAIDHGLKIKAHAEQLSYQGFARIAAELGAQSVDHIEYLPANQCGTLKRYGTVAMLLPGAYYFLRETQLPPVSALVENGVPMAVATDCNPGSSPLLSLRTAANMACVLFGLTPEQAFAGITRNAAQALGRQSSYGTIEIGKNADFAVWDVEAPAELIYLVGSNPLAASYKLGKKIEKNVGP
jgi:imidazolonepropionase